MPLDLRPLAVLATVLALGCATRPASKPPSEPPASASPASPASPAPPQTAEPIRYDDQTETRIARILADLRTVGPGPGQLGEPMTLAEVMERGSVRGLSVAVIDQGRLAWARGFGVRHFGEPTPVDTRTLFEAGSISKPVFAAAVMRMATAGTLDIDADVNERLHSWKVPAAGEWQPTITLRNLLTHSAGTTVHGFPGYAADVERPSVAQLLSGEPPANTPPVYVDSLPGLQPRYSGGGTTIAQLLVTDVAGQPFPEVMQQWVLEPFGMDDSTYAQPLPPAHARWAASAHTSAGRPIEGRAHVYPEMAAAGLWTTPTDLARFALGIVASARGDQGAPMAQSAATEMLTAQTAPHMGIGVFLFERAGVTGFGHDGRDEGFDAMLAMQRDGQRGLVMMVNGNHAWIFELMTHAIAREYGWPPEYGPPPEPVTLDPKTLGPIVGRYEVRAGYTLEVVLHDGVPWLVAPGQAPLRLIATSERQFFAPSTRITVQFSGPALDRPPTAMTIDQGRGPIEAKRVEP